MGAVEVGKLIKKIYGIHMCLWAYKPMIKCIRRRECKVCGKKQKTETRCLYKNEPSTGWVADKA